VFLLANNLAAHNCQGMGDLLSPILHIVEDEALSFWCFENLMQKMEANFFLNSKGMDTQLKQLRALLKFMDPEFYSYLLDVEADSLYFCFRWLLVLFKREFEYEDVKRLWEACWTDLMGSNFHLFLCYTVVAQQRDAILKDKLRFDEILKLCIDLSGKIDLLKTIEEAEQHYIAYELKLDAAKQEDPIAVANAV
jgi:hypothetical protein